MKCKVYLFICINKRWSGGILISSSFSPLWIDAWAGKSVVFLLYFSLPFALSTLVTWYDACWSLATPWKEQHHHLMYEYGNRNTFMYSVFIDWLIVRFTLFPTIMMTGKNSDYIWFMCYSFTLTDLCEWHNVVHSIYCTSELWAGNDVTALSAFHLQSQKNLLGYCYPLLEQPVS